MSGTMMKKTGEVMEDYSEEHDGCIGKMAGFGGRIHTAVGGTVENMAKKDVSENSEKSKTEQLTGASKEVFDSAIDSVKEKDISENIIIMKAQERLHAFGYDPGSADGIMGNKTKQAIGEYQQSKNLKVTKVLDEQTLSALNIPSTE
jgi:hypothetical protein